MAGVKDFLPQKVRLMESVQISSVMTKKLFPGEVSSQFSVSLFT